MRRSLNKLSLCAGGMSLMAIASAAHGVVTIDGSLDADYGSAAATQTNNTQFGDSTTGNFFTAGGSELDAAYGVVQNGSLNLLFTGNLETNFNHLDIFVDDGRSTGQSVLAASGTLGSLNGSKFSTGFKATYALDINGGVSKGANTWFINSYQLAGSAASENLGGFTPTAAGFAFNDGKTDSGVTFSFDNSNVAGVNGSGGTASDPTAADAVTTGFEMSIPLGILGSPSNPSNPIKVLALVSGNNDNFISNQFLPGLPTAQGNIGNSPNTFDFSSTPSQYFSVAVPASTTVGTWNNTGSGGWEVASNWTGKVPNAPADSAVFDSAITAPSTVHLDGSKTVGRITFNNTNSYTIDAGSGGTLTIDDTGDIAGVHPTIAVEQGSHFISAPVAFSLNTTVDVASGSSLSVSGNISGGTSGDGTTGFLVKTGSGSLLLSGTNSFTGGISVHGGSVEVDTNAALPNSGQQVFIGDGTSDNVVSTLAIGASGLTIATPIQTNVEQSFFNIGTRVISATYTSGSSTLSSPITVNGSVVLQAASGATLNVTGAIVNGTDTNSSVTHDLSVTGPGTVVLSNAETYTGSTIVNSGTLTLAAAGSIATDSSTIDGTTNLPFNVFVDTAGTFNVNGTLTGVPIFNVNGTVNFGQATTRKLAGLNITGGTVSVAPAATHASRTILTTGGLTMNGDSVNGWSGKLDLSNNDMIVQAGANTDINNITSQLKSGFAAGTGYWNGASGIVSSAAAADTRHLTTLGVILNDNGAGGPIYTSFPVTGGQPTGLDDVLVKYTYYGDANLDGVVNGADYQQIDMGFGSGGSTWATGDFNYDGVVNGSDFALIDNTFNQITATGASPLALIASPAVVSAVPEPASLGLLGIGIVASLGRRSRRASKRD